MGSALLLAIVTFIIVYVVVFKDDFKKEDIEKVSPFLLIIALLSFLIFLMSNI